LCCNRVRSETWLSCGGSTAGWPTTRTLAPGVFVVLAAISINGPAWLLVLGFTGHGLKYLWQEHRHHVANTRWWPPFCFVVD
jgi:hypothetical protein